MPASSYHHGHLREALVEAAVEAARESGPDGLALRELARRVGVSHNAAYRHFARREDLVAEVGSRAMVRLSASMRRRLDAVDGPDPVLRARSRLDAVGRAYVDFAVTETGLFRVALAAWAGTDDPRLPLDGPYGVLGRALDDLVEVGFLSVEAREGAETVCWSAVHGFATLAIDGHLGQGDPDRLQADLEVVLVAVDRSLGASTGVVVAPTDAPGRR